MQHADIIDACGGNHILAARLGLDHTTVSRWRRRGIPPIYWHQLPTLAYQRSRIGLEIHQIAQMAPRRHGQPRHRNGD